MARNIEGKKSAEFHMESTKVMTPNELIGNHSHFYLKGRKCPLTYLIKSIGHLKAMSAFSLYHICQDCHVFLKETILPIFAE